MNELERIPLCIDAGWPLTPAHVFHEAVFSSLRAKPWRLFLFPLWILQGSKAFHAKVAETAAFEWAFVPTNDAVVRFLNDERAGGRHVVLVSSLDKKVAEGLAEHLGTFDEVLAPEYESPRAECDKASLLRTRFGDKGFDYIGNPKSDANIWSNARRAIEVSGVARSPAAVRFKDNLRMLRIHQWLKNALVFVPGIAAHRMTEPPVFLASLLAFLSFSLCASSVYVLNDMLDLPSDRRHPRKRARPLAAARIPIARGAAFIPVLLSASTGLALLLPPMFFGLLIGYFVCTLAYSVLLKRQVIVDVMMLAGLYTIRVIAGALATRIQPSFWLLAFSMFIFLSLALVKRYAELNLTLKLSRDRPAGRGYSVHDLPVLLSLGAASGFCSVLIVALYINNPTLLSAYPSPVFLWFVPALLLYWVSRLWMKTHRGEMHDDPIVFTMRDWQSLTVLALSAVCFLLAAKSGLFVEDSTNF